MLPPEFVRVARAIVATLMALGLGGTAAAPASAVPMMQAPPTLSGVVAVGSTVTCVPGQWTGNGTLTKSYRWVIDGRGADPYVATGLTYEPMPADQGWPLQCEETVSDTDDTAAQNTSAQTVLPPQPLVNASPPSVLGSAVRGETLTCDPGTWSRTATYAYSWLRMGQPIPGAVSSTLQLGADDIANELACRVTATATVGGQTAVATSAIRLVVDRREIPQPGKPTVSGEARVGEVLRCTPAAGSEEYQHEWQYASGTRLGPSPFSFALTVPGEAAGQQVVCAAIIENLDGYRAARSDPVTISPLRRPPGLTDFPLVEQTPLAAYLAAIPTAQVARSSLAWRSATTVLPPGDVRVNGIELTQATQYRMTAFAGAGLPNRCNADPVPWTASICPPGEPVRYAGVKLVAGRTATARVFIDRAGARRTSAVQVRVTVRTGTGTIIGSMVQTATLTSAVAADSPRLVTDAQRRDPAGSVNFTIPGGYVRAGTTTYEAEVVPTEEACPTGSCTANNRFVLVGVPAIPTGILRVGTARVRYEPAPPAGNRVSPNAVTATTLDQHFLGGARAVLPVRAVEVRDQGAELTANTSSCDFLLSDPGPLGAAARADDTFGQSCRGLVGKAVVDRFAAQSPAWFAGLRRYDTLLGLSQATGYARGWGTREPSLATLPRPYLSGPTVIAELSRPLRTVAHELGHNAGLPHAGAACDGGGGEAWPPDDEGRLQGVGWFAGKPRYDGLPGDPAIYDLMSYCGSGGDGDVWVSPRNWDRMVETFSQLDARAESTGTLLARRAQAGALPGGDHLFVTAFAASGAARVERVEIGPARVVTGTPTAYVVRAVGADGAVLATSDALAVEGQEGPASRIALLQAQLPPAAAGATRVEIALKDSPGVAGALDRPAALPAVQVDARARPGRRGGVTVTWSAPRAKTADLVVSIDGGRTWRPAWSGAATPGRAVLDGRQLPRTARAKVRLRVSDGWNAQTADSRAFASEGTPPQLTLAAPTARTVTIQQGEALALQASAVDDAGRALRKGAIAWLDGGRRVAAGESATLTRLTPGRHRLMVVARDRFGRVTSKRFTVRVRAAAPTFTTLIVPPSAPAGSRTVKVQVAASRAAELRVAGRRVTVGARAKTITVPLPKAKDREAVLTFELRADGRSSRVEAAVARS